MHCPFGADTRRRCEHRTKSTPADSIFPVCGVGADTLKKIACHTKFSDKNILPICGVGGGYAQFTQMGSTLFVG
jgi:hypothetical protein